MKIKQLKRETLHSYYEAYRAYGFDAKDRFLAGVSAAYRLTLGNMGYDAVKLLSLKYVWEEMEKIKKQVENDFEKKYGKIRVFGYEKEEK